MIPPIPASSAQTTMPVISEPKLTVGNLPKELHQLVINFLSMQNIAQSVHRIQKAWRYETGNDGRLDLSSTKINFLRFLDIIGSYINASHHIRSMNLAYCQHLDADLVCTSLQFMPSLTKLRLPYYTTDKGLSHFKSIQGPLKHLSLESCRGVTDRGLQMLAQTQLPLEYLNLQGCSISNKGIEHISTFPLTYLDMGSCTSIDDKALKLLSTHPLTTLKMARCQNITDEGMGYISGLKLTRLYLSNLVRISDQGFGYLNGMPLKELRLDHTAISDECLFSLEFPSLKDLDLGDCRNITDTGLQGLEKFPLKRLGLSGFKCMTDDVFDALSQSTLTSLTIPATNINDTQLAMLSKLPLRNLNIRVCYGLTPSFGDALLQFSSLITVEFTPTVHTGKRQSIAFPIGVYFQRIHLFGKEIPASVVSKPVEEIYDTILEYLEPKVTY